MQTSIWDKTADALAGKHKIVLAVVLVLTIAFGAGATRLKFKTEQDSVLPAGSAELAQVQDYLNTFGGQAVLVAWNGPIENALTAQNFPKLLNIEKQLNESGEFFGVLGPATAAQFARDQILGAGVPMFAHAREMPGLTPEQLEAVEGLSAENLTRLAEAGLPAGVLFDPNSPTTRVEWSDNFIENKPFVDFLFYEDPEKTTIRKALRDNYPDSDTMMMLVRLPGDAKTADLGKKLDKVKEVVAANQLDGFTYVVSGAPALLTDVNKYLQQGGMGPFAGIGIVLLLILLYVFFGARWRFLPLLPTVLGVLWTLGLMGWFNVWTGLLLLPGLPVLLGLGLAFATAQHARHDTVLRAGGTPQQAVRAGFVQGGSVAGALGIGTSLAALALLISQVPMFRMFAWMLVIGGLAMALSSVLTTVPVLAWREAWRPTQAVEPASGGLNGFSAALAGLGAGFAIPVVLLVIGAVIAVVATTGKFPLNGDPEKWVPATGETATQLNTLKESIGFSSDIGLIVKAPNVNDTNVVQWMERYAQTQVEEHPGQIVRYTSIPMITGSVLNRTVPPTPLEEQVLPDKTLMGYVLAQTPKAVLGALSNPAVEVPAVAPGAQPQVPDQTAANIIFVISPSVDVAGKEAIIENMRESLASGPLAPPSGVSVGMAGLALDVTDLQGSLEEPFARMAWIGVAILAVWLLVAFRSLIKAILASLTVLLALGGTALFVYLVKVELTPLSAVWWPVPVAVGGALAVTMLQGYAAQRAAGLDVAAAGKSSGASAGRAALGAGLGLTGFFVGLMMSPYPLVRGFGTVMTIALLCSVVSAVVLLPPLLKFADANQSWTFFRPDRGKDLGGAQVAQEVTGNIEWEPTVTAAPESQG